MGCRDTDADAADEEDDDGFVGILWIEMGLKNERFGGINDADKIKEVL